MKKIISSVLTGSITFMFAVAPALAASTDDPGIQKREAIQQKRIEQGVASGQLTPREAGHLEAREAKIKQDEERMKSDGNLTNKERAKLTREQNRASKKIYNKKHNLRKADVGETK
ncbi:MAG TPA: hypothetical protein VK448_11170 [Dissulfurispiraceae bacterium]|nr:hypothetical protein [Dissulfurispiraceae bacterium]